MVEVLDALEARQNPQSDLSVTMKKAPTLRPGQDSGCNPDLATGAVPDNMDQTINAGVPAPPMTRRAPETSQQTEGPARECRRRGRATMRQGEECWRCLPRKLIVRSDAGGF
jgi:hypothetical protein